MVEHLPKEAPDLVIEFAPEDTRVKQAVYAEVEAAYPDDTPLIASGTSGLDLVELARRMKRPERFLGVHYFMPADTAPVVEVMAGLPVLVQDAVLEFAGDFVRPCRFSVRSRHVPFADPEIELPEFRRGARGALLRGRQ